MSSSSSSNPPIYDFHPTVGRNQSEANLLEIHPEIVSLKPALRPVLLSFCLLFLSAITLPSRSRWATCFRICLLPPIFALAYDILLNRSYSWGSTFRDSAFPSLAFLIVFRALDFSILNLWDPSPAFHWIVPVTEDGDRLKPSAGIGKTDNNDRLITRGVEERSRKNTDADPDRATKSDDRHSQQQKKKKEDENRRDNDQPGHSTITKKNDDPIPKNDTSPHRLRQWRKVPYPPLFSFDRILWTIDNITLLRPGTPWIFPWKLRALEWSQKALETNEPRFGEPEWPLWAAIIQQTIHYGCHTYIRHLDLQPHQSLWDQPLYTQCALTFALGGIVSLGNAVEEAITFPLFIKFGILPPTAIMAHSKRAILSSGLGELWGRRWHHIWRRSYARSARLVPGASRHPLIHAFATFFISAAMHCLLIARVYPMPTFQNLKTFIPFFYEKGIYIFFLSQGIGAIIERIILPTKSKSTQPESVTKRVIRLIWLYFVLIGSGRYVTNSLVSKGLMTKKEWNSLNYRVIAKMFYDMMFPNI